MGGFFGVASSNNYTGCFSEQQLSLASGNKTRWYDIIFSGIGFSENIHSIENSPFRTKFEKDIERMRGNICIGCISDTDPQPIMVRSKLGLYAVCYYRNNYECRRAIKRTT